MKITSLTKFARVSAIFAVIMLLVTPSLTLAADDVKPRLTVPAAITVPDGYHIEPVVTNLSVPTTAIFDGKDMLIGESGWKDTAKARVIRVKPDGTSETVAEDGLVGPVTGLLMVKGQLYISHLGKVSVVGPNKTLKDIVTGLPSNGDHQNNNIVMGPDGKIYMGQGTTTNSGVVGTDSLTFGWLMDTPTAHDVPCHDVTLTGQNFQTEDVLNKNDKDQVSTGAYQAFGTPTTKGQVVKGNPKCGGAILRFNPDGSDLQMFAWGMRNPFGLKFDTSGQLWATYHGADVRGSRSIYNDPDYFVKVDQGAWYGWPDYFDGMPVTDPRFKDPTKAQAQMLWATHPTLSHAYLTFESHGAANGFAFSPSDTFGYKGDAFVADYGTYSVATAGTDPRIPGFKVMRVDLQTKEVTDFAKNKLPGPAYLNFTGGLDRPSDIVFGPDDAMYIVDWGGSTIGTQGLKYVAGSGVVWRVYKDGMKALRPNGAVVVTPAPVPPSEQKAEFRNIPQFYKDIAGPVGLLTAVVLIILAVFGGISIRLVRGAKKKTKRK